MTTQQSNTMSERTRNRLCDFKNINYLFSGNWTFLTHAGHLNDAKFPTYKDQIKRLINGGSIPEIFHYKVITVCEAAPKQIIAESRRGMRVSFTPEYFSAGKNKKESPTFNYIAKQLASLMSKNFENSTGKSVYIINVEIEDIWWGIFCSVY